MYVYIHIGTYVHVYIHTHLCIHMQAAQVINSDNMHVLVDLTGHTLSPQVHVLAMRPAGEYVCMHVCVCVCLYIYSCMVRIYWLCINIHCILKCVYICIHVRMYEYNCTRSMAGLGIRMCDIYI